MGIKQESVGSEASAQRQAGAPLDDSRSGLHNLDARQLTKIVQPDSVDLILTSPPYADLKDYGSGGQIGFGQTYDEYLKDMRRVFERCHEVAKPTATMWVVSDTLKKNGELVNLPAALCGEATATGWKLQDIIIWHKTKTLPWSRKGQVRNIFEYIFVFAKSKKYKYYPERIRETDGLGRWWMRYPERYNPRGKTPHNIWNFPIPTQGSWGNGVLRHFNPFPPALVERIVDLTTDPGDIVLDPFAGSGTVLAQAGCMGRQTVGLELNTDFVRDLYPALKQEILGKWSNEEQQRKKRKANSDEFGSLILRLRKVKLVKHLVRALVRDLRSEDPDAGIPLVAALLVNVTDPTPCDLPKFSLDAAEIILVVELASDAQAILAKAVEICGRPPLSKFGILPRLDCIPHTGIFDKCQSRSFSDIGHWHVYPATPDHHRLESTSSVEIDYFLSNGMKSGWMIKGLPPVFSDVRIDQGETEAFTGSN